MSVAVPFVQPDDAFAESCFFRYEREAAFLIPLCAYLFTNDNSFLYVLNLCLSFYYLYFLIRHSAIAKSLFQSKLYLAASGYIAYLAVSHLWSGHIAPWSTSFYFSAALFVWLYLSFLAVSSSVDAHFLRRSSITLFVIFAMVSIAALVVYLLRLSPEQTHRMQGIGSLKNPNLAGPIFAIGAWLCYARMQEVKMPRLREDFAPWAYWIGYALFAFCLIQTNSRSSLLAFGIILLFGAAIYRNKKAAYSLLVLPVFWGVRRYVVAPWIYYLASGQALTTTHSDATLSRGGSGRLGIWRLACEMILEKPIFGHGLGSQLKFHVPGYPPEVFHLHPHNIHLSCLAFGGLAGECLFLAVWGIGFWVGYRSFRQNLDCFLPGLLLFAWTCLFFDHCTRLEETSINWFLLWAPLGLLAGRELQLKALQVSSLGLRECETDSPESIATRKAA